MKRQKHRAKSKIKKAPPEITDEPQDSPKKKVNRRDFLGNSLMASVGVAAVGGVGWYFAGTMGASARESVLSDIGNGVPTVVQIHDPSCPTCNALLCEVRDASGNFEDTQLQFRVANLNTDEGYALAKEYGVGKITLLLFDGDGNRRLTLPGMNEAEHLTPVFERHVKRYGQKS